MPGLKRYELCTSAEADFSAIVNIIINNRHFESLVSCDLNMDENIFCQARTIRNNIMHSEDLKVADNGFQDNLDLLIQIIGSFKSTLPGSFETIETINRLKTGQMRIELDDVLNVRRERLVAMKEEVVSLVTELRQEVKTGHVALKQMIEVAKDEIRNQIETEVALLRQTIQSHTPVSKEQRIRANFKDGCRHSLLAILYDHIQRLRPQNKGPDEWTLLDLLGKIEYSPDMGNISERHRNMLYPIESEPLSPDKWDLFLLCQVPLIDTKIKLPNNIALFLKELKTTRAKLLENPDSVDFGELVSLCDDYLDDPLKESTKQIFQRYSVDHDIVLVDSVLKSWQNNENDFMQTQVNENIRNDYKKILIIVEGLQKQMEEKKQVVDTNEHQQLLRRVEELEKQVEQYKKGEDRRSNESMTMLNTEKSAETVPLGTQTKQNTSIKLIPINCKREDALRVEENITSDRNNIAKENGSLKNFTKNMNLDGTEPKKGSIILEVTLSSIKELVDFWDKCLDGRAVEALKDVRDSYRKYLNCQDLEFEVILTKGEVDRCLNRIVNDLAETMNARGILRDIDPGNLLGYEKNLGKERTEENTAVTEKADRTTKKEETLDPEREKEAIRLAKFLRQIAENLEGGQIPTVREYVDTIVVSAKEGNKKGFDKAVEDFINAATFKSGISVNLIKQSVRGFLIIQEHPSFGELVSSKLSSLEAEQKEHVMQFDEIISRPITDASSVKSSVLIEEDIQISDMDEAENTERIKAIQEREKVKSAKESSLKPQDDPFESGALLRLRPKTSSAFDKYFEISEFEKEMGSKSLPSTSEESMKSPLKYDIEKGIEPKTSTISKEAGKTIAPHTALEEKSVKKPGKLEQTQLEKMEEMDVSGDISK